MTGKNRGFTLIELMIVIGIIGVLASIGLFYMNQARRKADDAVIISQLSMARDSAQIFYETDQSYIKGHNDVQWKCDENNSMFVDEPSGMSQYADESNYPSYADLRCSANSNSFEISAALSTSGQFWCVNSGGVSQKITAFNHVQAHPNGDTDCIP